MNIDYLRNLLENIQRGKLPVEKAMRELEALPTSRLIAPPSITTGICDRGAGDHLRAGKTAAQMTAIMKKMQDKKNNILVTRLEREKVAPIKRAFPKARYYPQSRVLTLLNHPVKDLGKGTILVVCAGPPTFPWPKRPS